MSMKTLTAKITAHITTHVVPSTHTATLVTIRPNLAELKPVK